MSTMVVCTRLLVTAIVLRSHDTDSNTQATSEKLQVKSTTDTATTNAESTQAPHLPIENDAIATSAGTGGVEAESTPMENDSAKSVQHSANVHEDAAGNNAEEEREATATNQDEHDDHIVEGEEDTVIY